MAESSKLAAGPRAVPEGDARKIVAECRKCLEEEADRLGPSTRMRMVAIQRALEATDELPNGFRLKVINDQIRQIAEGVEKLPAAAVKAAQRADLSVNLEHRRSFFTSYISGKSEDIKKRRFNYYVRTACTRVGLGYIAVIGGSPDGKYAYYYLKHARDEAELHEPGPDIERVTAIMAESAPLLATRGWGADEVGQVYRNARAVSEKITVRDDRAIDLVRFEIAIGLWSHNLVRGNLVAAEVEAACLGDIAEKCGDRSMRVVALRATGTTELWLGRFVNAERDLRKCLEELGDGSGYRPFVADLGASPFSLVASDLAAALVVVGRHKEALETARLARVSLAGKNDPFHDCYSLTFSSWIKLELGELAGAAADARDLVQRASRFELAALRGLGLALDGITRTLQADDPGDGVGDVYRGLGEWQGSRSALFVSSLLVQAATVSWRAGNSRQADRALEEAFEIAAKTGEGFYVADMYRVRGDVQRACNKNYAGAEKDLLKALEIAGEQQSRTFLLRAATSLLRLARERNDVPHDQKAREIAERMEQLRDVLTAFDQEPECSDLRAARSLIRATVVPSVIAALQPPLPSGRGRPKGG
jgi:tetratricopeptide (TPR) repeat protein